MTGWKTALRRWLRALAVFRAPGRDENMDAFLALIEERFGKNAVIADLGSGGRRLAVDTIGIDLVRQAGVSVIADVAHVPIRSGSCDGVLITDVLMYVRNPCQVADEVKRILKPGGGSSMRPSRSCIRR